MRQMRVTEWTKEQVAGINYAGDKNVLIRGVAGSGKTMVLAERAIRLHEEAVARGERGRVAIMSFNHTILFAIREYLNARHVKTEDIVLTSLGQAVSKLHKKICHRETDVIENSIDKNLLEDVMDDHFATHFKRVRNRLQNKKFIWFLRGELAWMKQHHICRFADYESAVRYGRESFTLLPAEKQYVFDLYIEYFSHQDMAVYYIEDVYNELYNRRNRISAEDRFDYVLVDDIQDMPLNHLQMIPALCNYSYTVAGDYSQRLYSQGSPWKEAKDFLPADTITLTKSFRSSQKIMALANNLLSHNRLLYSDTGAYLPPDVMGEPGERPLMYRFDTMYEEEYGIAKILKKMMEKYPGDTIAVLTPTAFTAGKLRKELFKNGIPAQLLNSDGLYDLNAGIKVSTYYSVKGLSFDHVICVKVDNETMLGKRGTEWPSLRQDQVDLSATALYLGMTRARKTLRLTYSRELGRAPFMKELDKTLLTDKPVPGSEEAMLYRIHLGCPNAADLKRIVGRKVENKIRGLGIIYTTDTKNKLLYVDFDNGTSDIFPARALSKGGLQFVG